MAETEEDKKILRAHLRYAHPDLCKSIYSPDHMEGNVIEGLEDNPPLGTKYNQESRVRLMLEKQVPHAVKEGDEVLVRTRNVDVKTRVIAPIADRESDGWFPAIVKSVDAYTGFCRVAYACDHILETLGVNALIDTLSARHVVSAPGRSSSWGSGDLSGNVLPSNATRVQVGLQLSGEDLLPANFPKEIVEAENVEPGNDTIVDIPDYVCPWEDGLQLMSFTGAHAGYMCANRCPKCDGKCLHIYPHAGFACCCVNSIKKDADCQRFIAVNNGYMLSTAPDGRANAVQIQLMCESPRDRDWTCALPPSIDGNLWSNNYYARQLVDNALVCAPFT